MLLLIILVRHVWWTIIKLCTYTGDLIFGLRRFSHENISAEFRFKTHSSLVAVAERGCYLKIYKKIFIFFPIIVFII